MSIGMYNVLDFGAVGDGQEANKTVNRTAIQAAIDAALAASGGFVYMPAGIYCIDDTLRITGQGKGKFIKLGGDSYGTGLRMTTPNRDMLHVGGDGFEEENGVGECVVEYLLMNSSVAMAPDTYAIRVRN